jgi:glucosamine-6-phosphate deaminase
LAHGFDGLNGLIPIKKICVNPFNPSNPSAICCRKAKKQVLPLPVKYFSKAMKVKEKESVGSFEIRTQNLENLPVKIWNEPLEASRHVAKALPSPSIRKQQEGEKIVLGLATGSTPIKVYEELVSHAQGRGFELPKRRHLQPRRILPDVKKKRGRAIGVSCTSTFLIMWTSPENIHIPDGTVPMEAVTAYCERYEKLIDLAGGIDIQILGIGRTGHIGFNEPGAWETSPTRMVRLDHLTRHDAAKDFQSEDDVPYRAITMGVGSIFKARTVYLLAFGQHKAHIIQQAIEGEITHSVPASFLQKHPNTRSYWTKAAAEELTKMKSPWLAGHCNWNDDLICKAVVWLAQKTQKPILKTHRRGLQRTRFERTAHRRGQFL